MKKMMLILLFCIAAAQLFAQNIPCNVVFDLTTADTEVHARVIRWINAVAEADPKAKVAVVFYGKSLSMVANAEGYRYIKVANEK